MRAINPAGLSVIKKWEGIEDGDPTTVNLDPYLDPIGIWTIGWGHAIRGKDRQFLRGPANRAKAFAMFPGGLAIAQAEDLLRADAIDAAAGVEAAARQPLTENQFAALVSFQFNTGKLQGSTLLRKLNAGDYQGAAEQFSVWNKARNSVGQLIVLPGLVNRRADERTLFVTP